MSPRHSLRSSKVTASFVALALVTGLVTTGLVVWDGEGASGTPAVECESTAVLVSIDGAWQIGTAADLIALSKNPIVYGVGGIWSRNDIFMQTADIDLGGCLWSPIGTSEEPFWGNYFGNGFAINGLNITEVFSYAGLFGLMTNSWIHDLTLRGVININAISGVVGSVVGAMEGTSRLERVVSEVEILFKVVSGTLGGLVGAAYGGVIKESAYRGQVRIEGNVAAAGLVGYAIIVIVESSYSIATFDAYWAHSLASAGLIAFSNCAIPAILIDSYSVVSGQSYGLQVDGCSTDSNSFWNWTLGPSAESSTDDGSATTDRGRTTEEMRSAATYLADGWDIVNGWDTALESDNDLGVPARVWGICSDINDGYPFLLEEYASNPCAQTAPPYDPGPGYSSGEVYVVPLVVQLAVAPMVLRKSTFVLAKGTKRARLLGKSLNKDVFFAADSAKLSEPTKKTLRQATRLAIDPKSRVALTGFAALSSRGANHEKSVSQRRALAVTRYLRAQGFDAPIIYCGLSGKTGLVFAGEPRRVEIRILK